MKIAMITDARDPLIWWWQVHIKEISKLLINKHNCEIDLFTRKLKDEKWNKYIKNESRINWKRKIYRYGPATKFYNIFGRIISLFNISLWLYINAKKNKYDVIHAHSHIPWLIWFIVSKLTKIPIVYTVHVASYYNNKKQTFFQAIEKILHLKIKYNALITVWSYLKKYKISTKKVFVIWNWFNNEEISKYLLKQNSKKKKKIKNKQKTILCVWRLDRQKWIDILIKSLKYIKSNYILNVVWPDYEWLKSEYIKIAKENKVMNNVNFLWWQTWAKLYKEFYNCDLFVLPSRFEWFGIVILEAFAFNKIVISTKCGWPEDIIDNNKNWFLVDYESEKLLWNKINDVLAMNDSQKLKIIENSKEKLKIYSWGNITNNIVNVYKEIKK